MDEYILELARVAQITPRPNETLVSFAQRVRVHRAYAEQIAASDELAAGERAFHTARAVCCLAIEAAALPGGRSGGMMDVFVVIAQLVRGCDGDDVLTTDAHYGPFTSDEADEFIAAWPAEEIEVVESPIKYRLATHPG